MSFRGTFAPAWRHVARHTAFIFLSAAAGLAVSQSALASNITVASPINGAGASSTIWVRAHNVGCNGLSPQAFGYSIDNSTSIAWGVTAYDIDVTKVPVKPGAHTIHFKSWTAHGLCTVVNSNFTVSASSSGSSGSATSGSGSVLQRVAAVHRPGATRAARAQDRAARERTRPLARYPAML